MQRWIFFHRSNVIANMSPGNCRNLARGLRVVLAVAALAGAPEAGAQLRLPTLPSLSPLLRNPLADRVDQAVDQTLAPLDLAGVRLAEVVRRARAHRRELDRDPHGELIVRGELLAQPSSPAARDALRAAGFVELREEALDGLDEPLRVLQPPRALSLSDAVARARALDPDGAYDYHHVYLGGGAVGGAASTLSVPSAGAVAGEGEGLRVGLVDSGVDAAHPSLRGATLRVHGCDDGAHPAPHGTAVASLMVGRGPGAAFRSALPRAALFAGDAYCDAVTGGSVEAVARELAWLAREQVAVVNVSLVGPSNQILQRVIAHAVAQGVLIVAAAGNDGPAAPPLYPAAWPGVVGVGAVDGRLRLLPEGARGPQVMFVAPGADMAAAAAGTRAFAPVRGTSFAAPLVAGLLAASYQQASPAGAREAIARLAATARPLAAGTPADGFGRGLVGEALRTAPEAVTLVR
jgi:subtilisin family serine protease